MNPYSIASAIRGLISPKHRGMEHERSLAIGGTSDKLVVPFTEVLGRRATTETMLGTVGSTPRLDLVSSLEDFSTALKLGVRVLDNLSTPITLPRFLTGTVASFAGTETALSGAEEEPVFDTPLSLSPRQGRAIVPLSRTLALQTGGAIEALITEDIRRAIAEAFDELIFAEVLAAATPVETSGDAFTDVVALDIQLTNDKVGKVGRAYAVSTQFAATARLPLAAGIDGLLKGGQIDGKQAEESLRVPVENGILLVRWPDVLVGEFGPGLELSVSSMDDAGNFKLRGFLDADVAIRRDASAAKTIPVP